MNVTTHQEIMIDEEYMNEDFLVAVEGSCELKLEETTYLTTITDVRPYVLETAGSVLDIK